MYWNAFSDLMWRTMAQHASGDIVVTEEVLDGTHDGALVKPEGSVPRRDVTCRRECARSSECRR